MLGFLTIAGSGWAREPALTEVALEVPLADVGGLYVATGAETRRSWLTGGVRVARWIPATRGWWAVGVTASHSATAVFVGERRDEILREVDLAVDLSRTTSFGALAERRVSPTARLGVGLVGRVGTTSTSAVAGGPRATAGVGLMLPRAPARPFLEVGGAAGLVWPNGSPIVDCYTGPCTYSYWEDHILSAYAALGVRL